jgi:hypothetical protein
MGNRGSTSAIGRRAVKNLVSSDNQIKAPRIITRLISIGEPPELFHPSPGKRFPGVMSIRNDTYIPNNILTLI